MNTNSILTADILDIIFDGKNKDYGAYQLRKTYNSRLLKALLLTTLLLVFLISGMVWANKLHSRIVLTERVGPDIILDKIPPKQPPKIEIVLPPKKSISPTIEIKKLATPVIVSDPIADADKLPENDALDNAVIGMVNQDGIKSEGRNVLPVNDGGKDIIAIPKKEEDQPDFLKIEIEAVYHGGATAWFRFLNKTLGNNYPQEAIENGIEGTVIIQFMVDTNGTVSNVEAISGPIELRATAVQVIKKSGQWDAAIQNGRKVKSYKKQPIVFKLQVD